MDQPPSTFRTLLRHLSVLGLLQIYVIWPKKLNFVFEKLKKVSRPLGISNRGRGVLQVKFTWKISTSFRLLSADSPNEKYLEHAVT